MTISRSGKIAITENWDQEAGMVTGGGLNKLQKKKCFRQNLSNQRDKEGRREQEH